MNNKKPIEKNYFELLDIRDVLISLINGGWNKGGEKITSKLEFKASIFLKLVNEKLDHYDESSRNVIKKYVELDEHGDFVFVEDEEDKIKVKGDDSDKNNNKKLKYLDDDSEDECNKEIIGIREEKIEIKLPVTIKLSDFVDKNGNPLELGGLGYMLTDFVNLDE